MDTTLIQNIINNFPYVMVYEVVREKNGKRRFTYLSEGVRRFYGVTPEEAMADADLIYGKVHKDDAKRLHEKEEESFRSLSEFKSEVRVVSPSGDIRWSYFVSVPTKLEDGSTRWDGIEYDITERKMAEERIEAAEKKFSAIFEQSADAIVIADPDSKRILEVNNGAEMLLGYTKNELLEMTVDKLHPKHLIASTMKNFERHFSGEICASQTEVVTKEGRSIPVHIRANPIKISGKNCIIGIFRDVSEMKRIESELKERVHSLEVITEATMDREERILELKEKIKKLEAMLPKK